MWPRKSLYHRISFWRVHSGVLVWWHIFLHTNCNTHIYSHKLVLLFSLSWYSVLMLKRVQQETLPPSVGVAGQDFVGATLRQKPCGAATLPSFPSCDMVVVFLLLPDFSSQTRNWLVWHFSWFSTGPPNNCWESTVKVTVMSSHIFPTSSQTAVTIHPVQMRSVAKY